MSTVPKTRKGPYHKNVEQPTPGGTAATAQGDVNVVAEEGVHGNVPTAPVLVD